MKFIHIRPGRVFIQIASFVRRHLWLILGSCLALLLLIGGIRGLRFLNSLNVKPQDLLSFFGTPKEQLDSTNDTTNFLFLGIRGEGQDSPNLSDTILILSYNHTTKIPSMISVPRDLWVPSLKAKINAAYTYGEEASPGAGIKLAQTAILEDLGLPIHYTAIISFSLFQDMVDMLEGVDVKVETGFVDTEFPIPGKENALPISSRYETISFATGSAHMDGATALKFVRSRHSEGEEGTDYARSRRQQLVITALKEKILTPNFLLDEIKVNRLIDTVQKNLKTNIPTSLYPTLAKIALDTKDAKINSIAISDRPDKDGVVILFHPPVKDYSGEWVLIAKDGNWNALKKYLENKLKNPQ